MFRDTSYNDSCSLLVAPLLRSLHWLIRAPERIVYKLALLAYRYLHGLAPAYLADVLHSVTDMWDSCRRARYFPSSRHRQHTYSSPFLRLIDTHIRVYFCFLQRVSIACYAERCISHSKSARPSVRLSVRLSVCLSVRHTLALSQNDSSYDHGVFTGG